ncbi:MAG TPA: hypothetical protein VFI29_14970 [Hanamia sp.]|nr:hypothetical protein [Hanamia sp.]
MNQIRSIQYKAAFLLIAFSLNTVIGFACAVGLDMGFNSHCHEQNAIEATGNCHHDKSHHHGEAEIQHHKANNEKDNCCNDGVIKFQKIDKAISSSANMINPVFFASFANSFYNIDILSSSNKTENTKYFARRYRPPIPDIRVAIQSFQI